MAESRVPYSKQPISPADLLGHWESQGLSISQPEKALHYLKFIGYYRLRGYARHFQNLNPGSEYHRFRRGTTFENILDLYKFDRKLRTHLMDALEKIEVSIRTVVSETASAQQGPHWYMRADSFKDLAAFQKTDESLRKLIADGETKTKHRFLAHYYEKYCSPDLPPSWMLFETLSFGNISHIYTGLTSKIKKSIASEFDLSPLTLSSWVRSLSYLRNLCAHHCRVWNRRFTIKPELDSRLRIYLISRTDQFYIFASIIHYFLKRIKGAPGWSACIRELLGSHAPEVAAHMGFPNTWQTLSAWLTPSSPELNASLL